MKEERKEKIYDCVGIKHDMSHKDTGKAQFCGAGKKNKGKEREERYPKPLYIPIQ